MRAFECKMCGRCCEGRGGIVLSVRDLARIASYMGIGTAEFCDIYGEQRGGKLVIRSGDDGYCIFFEAGKGCTAHPCRPDICRAWPFFRGNLTDAVSLEMAAVDCAGINIKVGFAEFRRQGLEYLKEHDLVADEDDESAANALKVQI